MLKSSILGGDKRSVKAQKNILYSIGIKGVDTIVQLLLVPTTLGYLNQYEYGIWLTLNSILLWINSFDIGLGNGLRNQLASAIAKNDKDIAKSLISTAYGMITLIMFIILVIGSFIILNINWYGVLGAEENSVPNLQWIVYVSFALFCVNFMMKFIGNIYLAMQMPSINNLMVSSGHLLSLIIIYVLTKTTEGSLFNVAFAFSISPIIVYLLAYPITFGIVYSYLRPSIKLFEKKYLKDLFNVGVLFFLLQISGVVLFAMSNILISKLFGPDQVTPYNISYRYFSMIIMLMGIVSAPMWSATTDAYERNEFEWIRNTMKKLQRIMIVMYGMIVIMVIISPIIYRTWVGSSVFIPYSLSSLMAVYAIVFIWSTTYSNFLNGMGKLRIQTINTILVAIAFIPCSLLLSREYGIHGIVIAMILLNLIGAVLNTIQFNKLVNHKAEGIWNK